MPRLFCGISSTHCDSEVQESQVVSRSIQFHFRQMPRQSTVYSSSSLLGNRLLVAGKVSTYRSENFILWMLFILFDTKAAILCAFLKEVILIKVLLGFVLSVFFIWKIRIIFSLIALFGMAPVTSNDEIWGTRKGDRFLRRVRDVTCVATSPLGCEHVCTTCLWLYFRHGRNRFVGIPYIGFFVAFF